MPNETGELNDIDIDDLDRDQRLALERKGFIVDHPDHDDITRIPVDDWEHVTARVTGTPDGVYGEGMDICFDTLTDEHGVVELNVKGETVLRMVRVGGD